MSKKTGYFKRYAMTLLFPLGMYAVFALITLIIGNASFFTGYTTEGIIHDTVENTIIALAIAIPLSGGRWDFGPGAIIMLGAIIGGNLGMQLHMGTFGVLLCCVGACMMLALIEAVFYVTLRVPNMIISMGIVMVYEAVSGLLNNGLGVNFFANDTEYTQELLRMNQFPLIYILLIVVMAVTWFLLYKTKFGYEIDCIGKQWEFADAVGMHVSRKIVVIFVVGGALAGIAGATEILGVNYNFVNTFSANPGIGWDGFFVCILAGSNPVGILLFSIVFGALRYGALAAQTGLGVPLDLINIIKSTLVLFMAIKLIGNNREAIADFFGHIFHRSAVKKEG